MAPSLVDVILAKYLAAMFVNPQRTKVLTSATMAACGNVIGQYLSTNTLTLHSASNALIFGGWGAVVGMALHRWYAILRKVGDGKKGVVTIVLQLALDQLFFMPMMTAFFLIYLNVCRGNFSRHKISSILQSDWLNTVKLSWRIWPAAQILNFKYIPLEYQSIFGNVVALCYNVFLSMMSKKKEIQSPKILS